MQILVSQPSNFVCKILWLSLKSTILKFFIIQEFLFDTGLPYKNCYFLAEQDGMSQDLLEWNLFIAWSPNTCTHLRDKQTWVLCTDMVRKKGRQKLEKCKWESTCNNYYCNRLCYWHMSITFLQVLNKSLS